MTEMQEFSKIIEEFFNVEQRRRKEGAKDSGGSIPKPNNGNKIKSIVDEQCRSFIRDFRDTISYN